MVYRVITWVGEGKQNKLNFPVKFLIVKVEVAQLLLSCLVLLEIYQNQSAMLLSCAIRNWHVLFLLRDM